MIASFKVEVNPISSELASFGWKHSSSPRDYPLLSVVRDFQAGLHSDHEDRKAFMSFGAIALHPSSASYKSSTAAALSMRAWRSPMRPRTDSPNWRRSSSPAATYSIDHERGGMALCRSKVLLALRQTPRQSSGVERPGTPRARHALRAAVVKGPIQPLTTG